MCPGEHTRVHTPWRREPLPCPRRRSCRALEVSSISWWDVRGADGAVALELSQRPQAVLQGQPTEWGRGPSKGLLPAPHPHQGHGSGILTVSPTVPFALKTGFCYYKQTKSRKL